MFCLQKNVKKIHIVKLIVMKNMNKFGFVNITINIVIQNIKNK
jgi:hypothetical protein